MTELSKFATALRRSAGTLGSLVLAVALLAAPPPAIAVSLDILTPQATAESSGSVGVTVRLAFDVSDNPAPCSVSGTLTTQDGSAIAGSDYQATSVPFALAIDPAQQTAQQIVTIQLVNDSIAEADETFDAVFAALNLQACPLQVNASQGAGVLVTDDDQGNASITFSASALSVNENAGVATVQVTLNGTASLQAPFVATVDIATLDGTANANGDFTALATTLTFDQAQTSQTVTVPITNDAVSEANETFDLQLSNASALINDTRAVAVALPTPTLAVTIIDDDNGGTLQFSATALTAPEAGGPFTVTVTRTGNTAGAVSVDYATAAGTATSGVDFTPVSGTLSWAAGDGAPKTFALPIVDDTVVDPNETITLSLSNPTGGALIGGNATVTIQDNESQVDAGADVTVATSAGATVTSTFFVTGTPPVTLSARLGTVAPATLNAPGNATYTYVVPASTPAGTTINDTVTVTDQGGSTATKQFALQVGMPAARNLTDIPTLTPNQRALATWFDDFCPRIATIGAATPDQADLVSVCANLRNPTTTDGQVVSALDAINPEIQISAAATALRLSSQQHGNLEQRINALRSGATGIDLAGINLEIDGKTVPGAAVQSLFDALTGGAAGADDFGRWGMFVNGRVDFGNKDKTANTAGFDFDTIELTSGIDYRLRDNFVIGFAVGYNKINADFDRSAGSLDIESWNGSLFATYFSEDKFYIDASVNLGGNAYDSKRHIVYTDSGGPVDRTANSDSDGIETSGGIATGYDFVYSAWTFGPHVGSFYTDVGVNQFREEGAGGLDMIVGDQHAQSFTVNGGGHASYVFALGWGVLVPHLRVDYVHEFQDSRELIGVNVAADPFKTDPTNPTPTIVLQTDRPDPDYVVWSAGVSAQFINGISGFVNYQSTAGYDNLTLTDLTYGLRWERTF